ncbi:hypothetical protein SKAU_G00158310 [Synaphobranchus kaupii]|uniref:Uncharacterized protein n=1 Tax=Synaphobranchus kaupii TaxID=118154 RepID=A0A9Q1FI44_SYNKA|nr:hypothetical protein SKAU_G00158310 [Synaphobranchus kaupii]
MPIEVDLNTQTGPSAECVDVRNAVAALRSPVSATGKPAMPPASEGGGSGGGRAVMACQGRAGSTRRRRREAGAEETRGDKIRADKHLDKGAGAALRLRYRIPVEGRERKRRGSEERCVSGSR